MRTTYRTLKNQAGFTLVEMAIVMIIIGLILGAVMIGRDAQRKAEYMRIHQGFVNQWVAAYNTFATDRGVVLGDSEAARQGMVNGKTFAGRSGGDMTQATEPDAICEAEPLEANAITRKVSTEPGLRMLLLEAGIELPTGRAGTQEDRYSYMDSKGNPQELQVCFQWNRPGTPSGAGNVMVLAGLTPDLARFLDQQVDGAVSAAAGRFRQEGVSLPNGSSEAERAGIEWGADNLDIQGSNDQGQEFSDVGRDAQVRTVVAHYKMLR